MSDDLRAALAALTPSARDLFRHALRHPAEPASTSQLMISGGGTEDDEYLLDDLVHAINRGTLDSDERLSLVQMLDEIDAASG